MLIDCPVCTETFLEDELACPSCGSVNRAAVDDEPLPVLWEKALFWLAGWGLATAAILAFGLATQHSLPRHLEPMRFAEVALCGAFGLTSLVLIHTVEPSELKGRRRVALNAFIAVGWLCVSAILISHRG